MKMEDFDRIKEETHFRYADMVRSKAFRMGIR